MATWREVDKNCAPIPAGRMRQFPAGRDAFQRQKGRCNDHHGERGEGEVEHGLNRIRRNSIMVVPRTAGAAPCLDKGDPPCAFRPPHIQT